MMNNSLLLGFFQFKYTGHSNIINVNVITRVIII